MVIAGLLSVFPVHAHDTWISRGNFKNPAGEFCCGDYDCKSYSQVQTNSKGWIVENDSKAPSNNWKQKEEEIPFDEALPIAPPDGQVTVCRRPDGSRRCVFGIKPGL